MEAPRPPRASRARPGPQARSVEEILAESRVVEPDKLAAALAESSKTGVPLQQVVVDRGLADKARVLRCLSRAWGIKAVDLEDVEIEPATARLLPESTCRLHQVIAFAREGELLLVAIADPRNVLAVEDIRLRTGCELRLFLSLPSDITRALREAEGAGAADETLSRLLSAVEGGAEPGARGGDPDRQAEDIAKVDPHAPEVEKLVHAIILGALQRKASDIHLEPFERRLLVRYRIDGMLRGAGFRPPPSYGPALISKLKIMTGSMDITERRRPQDGRIRLTAGGKPVEFRVNIIPTVFGESCVMRVLDQRSIRVELDKLGFEPEVLEGFKRSLAKPYGLILVCGPTGSGKSTTLYSALNLLNEPDAKILTAENPVEFNLDGVVQLNVRQEIGLDFACALRAFLRQDPDVVMIGEIRDRETALIALEAAMTGHLVLSTIHTNDAPSAVARLSEMGVQPFMIASALEGVLAQRLLRKNCPECARRVAAPKELPRLLKEQGLEPAELAPRAGRGCAECDGSGYRGRTGIHEYLQASDELKALVLREVAAGPLRELASRQGMRTLLQDALLKVARGWTTLEEALRVCQ